MRVRRIIPVLPRKEEENTVQFLVAIIVRMVCMEFVQNTTSSSFQKTPREGIVGVIASSDGMAKMISL